MKKWTDKITLCGSSFQSCKTPYTNSQKYQQMNSHNTITQWQQRKTEFVKTSATFNIRQ
uniref:Uncharacterized protein n=1 Tax=Anguilla anguilla TaxID=7936 RepID=A0A0E9X557_ANGAN